MNGEEAEPVRWWEIEDDGLIAIDDAHRYLSNAVWCTIAWRDRPHP
jgi:hypothetical protein